MPVNRQEIFDGLSDTVYSVSAKYMSINIDAASILKYIASYEDLSFFFKKLLRGIDYQKEFYNNVSTDRYGNSRFYFPESKRLTLALMLGILKDIDTDEINFANFITMLYPDLKPEFAYERYCKEYFPIFLDYVYALYVKEENRSNFEYTSINKLDAKTLLNDTNDLLSELINTIRDLKMTTEKKTNEYLQYCDAFKQALLVGDRILIQNSFRVLKDKLDKRKTRPIISNIQDILQRYGII